MDTIEIILNAKPKFVFIENVPSFLNTKLMYNGENKTIKEILNLKLDRYYHIDSKIVDTADYGVPQHRRRTIVLMSRKRYAEKQIIIEKTVEHHTTVREAIGHLPKIEPFISDNKVKINNKEMYVFHKYHYPPFHTSRHISIMKRTPTGKSAFDNIDEFKPRKNDGKIVTGFSTTYKRMT
jgi:DNA (cytosine-5)-methyltransferase 1